MLGYLDIGKKEGAKAKVGGGAGKKERSYFVQSAVFTDAKNSMQIARGDLRPGRGRD